MCAIIKFPKSFKGLPKLPKGKWNLKNVLFLEEERSARFNSDDDLYLAGFGAIRAEFI